MLLFFILTDILTPNIIAQILGFLSVEELLGMCVVSKKVQQECTNDQLWKNLCHALIPSITPTNAPASFREFLVDNYFASRLFISIPK